MPMSLVNESFCGAEPPFLQRSIYVPLFAQRETGVKNTDSRSLSVGGSLSVVRTSLTLHVRRAAIYPVDILATLAQLASEASQVQTLCDAG